MKLSWKNYPEILLTDHPKSENFGKSLENFPGFWNNFPGFANKG